MVCPLASLGSTAREPIELLAIPAEDARQAAGTARASSVIQTPPPAAPTHSRQGAGTPGAAGTQVGAIASAVTRPESEGARASDVTVVPPPIPSSQSRPSAGHQCLKLAAGIANKRVQVNGLSMVVKDRPQLTDLGLRAHAGTVCSGR